jgi:hypothetical protein
VFSPSPEQIEYAELLLRRANGDLQACRVLADEVDIDDNIVGFHVVWRGVRSGRFGLLEPRQFSQIRSVALKLVRKLVRD